jgi:hypothetical protein
MVDESSWTGEPCRIERRCMGTVKAMAALLLESGDAAALVASARRMRDSAPVDDIAKQTGDRRLFEAVCLACTFIVHSVLVKIVIETKSLETRVIWSTCLTT